MSEQPTGDSVLPKPSGDEPETGQPLSAPPAQRFLGGVAVTWFVLALLVCVILFVVWSVTR